MTRKPKQVYVIFSVDTEHDIISYKTKSAGWSKGIPLLYEVFDASEIRGKLCWLIEYNLKGQLQTYVQRVIERAG